ncbi:hypothetical protein [Moritella sp. Urea-trap-13]|uniref:hypothetical protein n=1 Tax=Moritella sp. Urea-trap-13 TaxID=2058327 RepID=UPI000C3272F0|nr:hypothetical protein [Moritella sp. Urea-trap-13]PKH09344.1 hypothetical protein CXF93_00430 [Moritella sp. Urea-trap-13]
MNFKQQLLICTVMTMSISACGGGDSPSGNAATPSNTPSAIPSVDGPKQELTQDEDSFIPTASNDNSLFNINASSALTYQASTTMQLQIASNSGQPCNINIYKEYDKFLGPDFTPNPSSQVMQINSDTCSYSGPIYILNQQQKLLAEVVSLQHATTQYSEILITSNTITLNID